MLNGVTQLNLDDKGRLAIPSRYREYLQDASDARLVITMSHERRLWVYPQTDWEPVEKKLSQLSDLNKAEAKIKRIYLGHAHEAVMDKNGRITIPPFLREKAQLLKSIVMIGVGNKFELWDEQKWNQEMDNDDWAVEITESLTSLTL